MHVVILTQYFPPEIGAPQNRLGFLARRLRETGHQVTVVTAMPNYPTGRVLEGWRRQLTSREDTEFGTVLRSWLYTSPSSGTARQLLNYGTFAGITTATAPFRVRRADVVLWESPPLFLAPTASMLARRLAARMVMNVSDLWPRSAIDLGLLVPGGVAARFCERLEAGAYRRADLVSCQTEGIVEGVRHRRPTASTCLFPNGVDLEIFRPRPPNKRLRQRLGASEESALVGYFGNFGRAQALEQLVEAAAMLSAQAPTVRVVLMGDGPRRAAVDQLVRKLALPNLTVLEPVVHGDVPEMLAALDVAVVPLADRAVFNGARPSKLFEVMAMGVPFVYAGRGEGASLASSSGAATVVPPEEPTALAAALCQLCALSPAQRQELGDRGRGFVAKQFDRATITDDFIGRMESLR